MAIPVEYRPAITQVCDTRVELDGWAAGAPQVTDAQGTRWSLDLRSLDTWHAAPALRLAQGERPGEHGALDGPGYLAERVITLSGSAVAVDRASAERARDIVTSVLGDGSGALSTMVVYEAGRPTRRAYVRRSAETKTALASDNYFDWSMVLVAPDPRRYAETLSVATAGLPQPGSGGLVFPLVFPLVFSSGVSGGSMSCTNAGTVATWPLWLVTGPVTGPVITNVDTGARLEFDTSFAVPAGQVMSIDSDAKTVTLAGANRRDRLYVAQWFRLAPGATMVRFSGASAFDAGAQLAAQWRDGWT